MLSLPDLFYFFFDNAPEREKDIYRMSIHAELQPYISLDGEGNAK
jgi:hypothetical protein